jgi:hypothetical protein
VKKGNNIASIRKEHTTPKGLSNRFLNALMVREQNKIKKKMKISIGGSCLVAAEKKTNSTLNDNI